MWELTDRPASRLAVALGYFDGVHRGHRQVLQAAVGAAARQGLQSGVFTFVFGGENPIKGDAILTPAARRARIEALGLDWYYCPDYDSFRDLTPRQFVEEVLIGRMNAAAVFCGGNFTFGRGGAGNAQLLRTLCEERGLQVTLLPMLTLGGAPVSSTRIRSLLLAGQVAEANRLLGSPYSIEGPVVHGQGVGSGQLGFPTINQLYAPGQLIPCSGVYLTRALTGGKAWPAATGLGSRPTLQGAGVTCESFLVDFSGDLYGQTVQLEFYEYLGPTQKFDTLAQLRQCIADAAGQARAYFAAGRHLQGFGAGGAGAAEG